MNIILGFGATEEAVRVEVKRKIAEVGADQVCEEYNARADELDKLSREDAPERYTRLFYYDNKIVFHHINRRHPFSDDGWAMLKVEEATP